MKKFATMALVVLFVAGLSSFAMAARSNFAIDGSVELMAAYEQNTGTQLVGGALAGVGDQGMNNRVEEKINLNVDADLKENIAVHVGIETVGSWGGSPGCAGGYGFVDQHNGGLVIDEAYIVAKELGYKPLTVKAGVQNVGYDLRGDGNYTFLSQAEMGAWKATLNYDPLYVDVAIGKLVEVHNQAAADKDLWVAAFEYYLEKKGKVQVILLEVNQDTAGAKTNLSQYSVGVTYKVLDPLEVFVELGSQGGKFGGAKSTQMAYNLGGEWTFAKTAHKPHAGLSYEYFGGTTTVGKCSWVSLGDVDETVMLEADRDLRDHGKGFGKLLTSDYSVLRFVGGAEVAPKCKLDAEFATFSLVKAPAGVSKSIGNELDVKAAYQYTDDLALGAALGYVMSGKAVESMNAAGHKDPILGLYLTATLNF